MERKTPFIRLTEGNLVQLGYGSRQRRLWTAETDRTSAIAASLSSDKDLTKRLLTQSGIPLPEGQILTTPTHHKRGGGLETGQPQSLRTGRNHHFEDTTFAGPRGLPNPGLRPS